MLLPAPRDREDYAQNNPVQRELDELTRYYANAAAKLDASERTRAKDTKLAGIKAVGAVLQSDALRTGHFGRSDFEFLTRL